MQSRKGGRCLACKEEWVYTSLIGLVVYIKKCKDRLITATLVAMASLENSQKLRNENTLRYMHLFTQKTHNFVLIIYIYIYIYIYIAFSRWYIPTEACTECRVEDLPRLLDMCGESESSEFVLLVCMMMNIYIYIYIYICVCVCMCVCVSARTDAHTCVCINMHTHIQVYRKCYKKYLKVKPLYC